MVVRTFHCKVCGKAWQTEDFGSFSTCAKCQAAKLVQARAKTCQYRHCLQSFSDGSKQNSQKFCTPEHRRREKMFRTGKAQDLSYFRENKIPQRTCSSCQKVWDTQGSALNRCPSCRDSLRHKTCRFCAEAFYDTSSKNTRKAHSACMREHLQKKHNPNRAPHTSNRTFIRRVGAIRTGDGGRIDDVSTLRKGTHTWWGRVSELLFLAAYPEAKDVNTEHGSTAPYDFDEPTLGKVDVRGTLQRKASEGTSFWAYNVEGLRLSCDHIFFVGYSRDRSKVERVWLVLSSKVPETSVRFAPGSREYSMSEYEVHDPKVFQLIQAKLEEFLALPEPKKPASRTSWLDDPANLTDQTRFNRGRRGELLYKTLYPGSIDINMTEGTTSPYDFMDPEGVRVNVKTSWWYGARSGARDLWTFARGLLENHNCDVYSCLCLDLNGVLIHEYRIPSSVWGERRTLHVYGGLRTKWSKYLVHLKVEGLQAQKSEEPEGVMTVSQASDLIQGLGPKDLNVVTSVVRILSKVPFPRREYSKDQVTRDLELLQEASGSIDPQGVVEAYSNAGFLTCDSVFEHRYDAQYLSNPSLRQAWADPRWMFKAVRFQHTVGDPFKPWNVYRALKAILRAPSNIRPAIAKTLTDLYCPEGGVVLDPCAGYGGRATGVLAAKREYVGVDPHPQAPEAFSKLFELVGGKAQFHNAAYEDVELGNLQADMAFTSPPYFLTEVYSKTGNQSSERYPTWELWLEGFLKPLFEKTFRHLKPDAVFCLNVSDVQRKNTKYHLVSESILAATRAGFVHETTLYMPLKQLQQKRKPEPILVFRKPTVKV